jgi:PTS system mannose-specific IID component
VGDRLIWAGWLPFCSFVALAAFGLGVRPLRILLLFLGLFNVGHLALLVWGLRTGWRQGMGVVAGLAHPVLRRGPQTIGQCAALAAGFGVPLAFARMVGPGRVLLGGILAAVFVGTVVVVKAQRRLEGWRFALIILSALLLFSVAR